MDNTVMLTRGMQAQLALWRDLLATGPTRLGWKIGLNDPADQQRMQLAHPIVGFLSSDRLHAAHMPYAIRPNSTTLLEAEVALLLGDDVAPGSTSGAARAAIEAVAPAIEIVDVGRCAGDLQAILSDNLFHEAVVLGTRTPAPAFAQRDLCGTVYANGEHVRALEPARVPPDFGDFVTHIADTLGAHDERLRAGDWIICGSITKPLPVNPGDEVVVDIGPLGQLSLTFR